MQIQVVLLSTTGEVRFVDVPDKEVVQISYPVGSEEYKEALCDRAFLWGQNDFQPRPMPSVSVGDVVIVPGHFEHEYFRVASVGFDKLTLEEYREYKKLEPRDRTMLAYGFGKKKVG